MERASSAFILQLNLLAHCLTDRGMWFIAKKKQRKG